MDKPAEAKPTCTDGELNGLETGIDCGFDSSTCSLCSAGFGCLTSSNCDEGLVCAGDEFVCVLAEQEAGAYVEVEDLELSGVSPT